jgi:hypothetical protein
MPGDPLHSLPKTKAAFVEPMDCLTVPKLPEGSQWHSVAMNVMWR